ncbi:Ig-like domain-containing protein, partial [Candidatus Micrarchaeota archaeon]|nr:Ig-like domain-containing protein [Candidatus Micrarchaeota archaeon]
PASILLNVENVGKPGKQTYAGNCTPAAPYTVKKGETFTCIVNITDREVTPSIGKNIQLRPQINYLNCFTDPNYVTTGSCSAANNYTSSGTIITLMETYSQILYCGDGICSPSIGENPTNCPADCIPPASIILNATPSIVVPDGLTISTITATVRDSSNRLLPDIQVIFYSAPVGKLSSPSATTTNLGVATVTVTSAQAGTATVTGAASTISNQTTVLFYYVPSGLNLIPTSLPGCRNAVIWLATVRDQQGNAIPDIEVDFSHNAAGVASFSENPGLTDPGGTLYTTFSDSLLTKETVAVTASAYVPQLNTNLTASVNLDYTPRYITLTPSHSLCSDDVQAQAYVTDSNFRPVCNVNVNFSHNSANPAAYLDSTSLLTLASGYATTTFHDSNLSGEVVTLTADSSIPGRPMVYSVNLDYTPKSIHVDSSRQPGCGSTAALITATVLDSNNQAICDATVSFSPNAGSQASLDPTSNTTDNSGHTSTMLSDTNLANEVVQVTGKVPVPGGYLSDTTTLDYAPSFISLNATKQPGCGQVLVTATVTDSTGNTTCGANVSFSHNSTEPTASLTPTFGPTDQFGQASTTFNDINLGNELVLLTGTTGGLSSSKILNYTPAFISLSVSPIVFCGQGPTTLTVHVSDKENNSVCNALLYLTACNDPACAFRFGGVSLTPSPTKTDSSGDVYSQVTYFLNAWGASGHASFYTQAQYNCDPYTYSCSLNVKNVSNQATAVGPPDYSDWYINQALVCQDINFKVHGSVYIGSAGSLTNNNVTMMMNATTPSVIEVSNGGGLYLYDHNGAASRITTSSASYKGGSESTTYVVWIDSGANFIMQNGELSNAGLIGASDEKHRNGLYIEGTATISNSQLINNVVGLTLATNSKATITGNTIQEPNWTHNIGIIIENTANQNLVDNNIINCPGLCDYAISLNSASNSQITNNQIGGMTDGDAIDLKHSNSNTIQGNAIDGNAQWFMVTGYGISLLDSQSNIITSNTITDTYGAISLDTSSYNSITNNIGTELVREPLIFLSSSHYNTITGNNLDGNWGSPIHYNCVGPQFISSNNNVVNNNQFITYGQPGCYALFIWSSNTDTFTNNQFGKYWSGNEYIYQSSNIVLSSNQHKNIMICDDSSLQLQGEIGLTSISLSSCNANITGVTVTIGYTAAGALSATNSVVSISGSTFSGVGTATMSLINSQGTISGNTISGRILCSTFPPVVCYYATQYAVYLENSPINLISNTIGSANTSVYFKSSNSNVASNTISANQYGVYCVSSSPSFSSNSITVVSGSPCDSCPGCVSCLNNGTCGPGENASACPQDCCNPDCSDKSNNKCYSQCAPTYCSGFQPVCNGLARGTLLCNDTIHNVTCCNAISYCTPYGAQCAPGLGCGLFNCNNGQCDVGESVFNCPQDCCNSDCTSKTTPTGGSDNTCHYTCSPTYCSGFASDCNNQPVGTHACMNSTTKVTCCNQAQACPSGQYCQSDGSCQAVLPVCSGLPGEVCEAPGQNCECVSPLSYCCNCDGAYSCTTAKICGMLCGG